MIGLQPTPAQTTEIFGVGPVIAALVIGDVEDINRFATRDRFAPYDGTAPIEGVVGWGSGLGVAGPKSWTVSDLRKQRKPGTT